MSAKGILGGEIVAAVVVIALVWGYSHHKNTEQKAKAEQVAAEKYAAEHPPKPPVVHPVQRPWSFRTLDIPAN